MGTSLVLEVQGTATDARDGVARAQSALDDGRAASLLVNLKQHFESAAL